MKATHTEHTRLVSNATTVLNTLKRSKKIKDFSISDINQGEIKVVIKRLSGVDQEIQLRSTYGSSDISNIVRNRIPEASEVSQTEKVELVEA
jgi:hypothetical protein